jgi:DNA recombination protein RmuC
VKRSINPLLVERAKPESDAEDELENENEADDSDLRVRRLHE